MSLQDIFGVPGMGTAIVDYLGTILIAMIVTKIPLVITTICAFILHYLFSSKTGTEMWLFGSKWFNKGNNQWNTY